MFAFRTEGKGFTQYMILSRLGSAREERSTWKWLVICYHGANLHASVIDYFSVFKNGS